MKFRFNWEACTLVCPICQPCLCRMETNCVCVQPLHTLIPSPILEAWHDCGEVPTDFPDAWSLNMFSTNGKKERGREVQLCPILGAPLTKPWSLSWVRRWCHTLREGNTYLSNLISTEGEEGAPALILIICLMVNSFHGFSRWVLHTIVFHPVRCPGCS